MKEQELFDWLKENNYPDLVKSEGTYDTFDCLSDEFRFYIELKSRLTHYPDLLLERKKFMAVTQKAEELGYIPWYINSTPVGIFGFRLDSLNNIQWEIKWLPKTTEFVDKGKIDKEVTFLDTAKADFAIHLLPK